MNWALVLGLYLGDVIKGPSLILDLLLNLFVSPGNKNRIFRPIYRQKIGFRAASKKFALEKIGGKKNRQKIADFSLKNPIFPCFFFLFLSSKKYEKLLLKGFEPTQNAYKWHPPTTKPLITLIIYSANFFYIILLFNCL